MDTIKNMAENHTEFHGERAKSYATTLRGKKEDDSEKKDNRFFTENLDDSAPSKNFTWYKGAPMFSFSAEEIDDLSVPMKFALVGRIVSGHIDLATLRQMFVKIGLGGSYTLGLLKPGFFLINLSTEEDFTRVWLRDVWRFPGVIIKIYKWTPNFSYVEEPTIVPVWVALPLLHQEFFPKHILKSLASPIGIPLKLDGATAERTRPSVARINIAVDLAKERVDHLWLKVNDEIIKQPVFYENLPLFCKKCKSRSHSECGNGRTMMPQHQFQPSVKGNTSGTNAFPITIGTPEIATVAGLNLNGQKSVIPPSSKTFEKGVWIKVDRKKKGKKPIMNFPIKSTFSIGQSSKQTGPKITSDTPGNQSAPKITSGTPGNQSVRNHDETDPKNMISGPVSSPNTAQLSKVNKKGNEAFTSSNPFAVLDQIDLHVTPTPVNSSTPKNSISSSKFGKFWRKTVSFAQNDISKFVESGEVSTLENKDEGCLDSLHTDHQVVTDATPTISIESDNESEQHTPSTLAKKDFKQKYVSCEENNVNNALTLKSCNEQNMSSFSEFDTSSELIRNNEERGNENPMGSESKGRESDDDSVDQCPSSFQKKMLKYSKIEKEKYLAKKDLRENSDAINDNTCVIENSTPKYFSTSLP